MTIVAFRSSNTNTARGRFLQTLRRGLPHFLSCKSDWSGDFTDESFGNCNHWQMLRKLAQALTVSICGSMSDRSPAKSDSRFAPTFLEVGLLSLKIGSPLVSVGAKHSHHRSVLETESERKCCQFLRPRSHRTRKHICTQIWVQTL